MMTLNKAHTEASLNDPSSNQDDTPISTIYAARERIDPGGTSGTWVEVG